jgi:hypothetical protein
MRSPRVDDRSIRCCPERIAALFEYLKPKASQNLLFVSDDDFNEAIRHSLIPLAFLSIAPREFSMHLRPARIGMNIQETLLRGSSFVRTYSMPRGPIAVTCVTYSLDFAQWKCDVLPGSTTTAPGGYASSFSASNSSPNPI